MKNLIIIVTLILGIEGTTYGQECNYRTNEVDEFTERTKIFMQEETWITHTDSALKKYYKRRNYLTTNVFAGRIDDASFIYFKTTILSKKAYDYYGSLRSDSEIMIKTDSGMVKLKIQTSDTGDTDYDKGETKYSVYCILTPDDIHILSTAQATKVRVYWSKGFEDYTIVDTEIFNRQLKCIK